MTTDTQPSIETSLVALSSTLRISDIAEFKQTCDSVLESAPQTAVACDASAVEFIDAAALQYLVALSRHCASQQRGFAIREPSAAFISAVTVSGFAVPLGLAAN